MNDLLAFIATWEHSKLFLLLLFMTTFLGIIFYLVKNPARNKRLESYKDIPFIDDEELVPHSDNKKKETKEQ